MISLSSLWIGVSLYIVGASTPGPGTMTIANTAMVYGRKAGLSLAIGVFVGSLVWGLLVGAGLSAVMLSFGQVLIGLKILGAFYLCWLGCKAFSAVFKVSLIKLKQLDAGAGSSSLFLQGLILQLTNPQSIITWLGVVTIGLPIDSSAWAVFLLVAISGLLGGVIFCSYALLFSTSVTQQFFTRHQQPLNGLFAVLYFIMTALLVKSLL